MREDSTASGETVPTLVISIAFESRPRIEVTGSLAGDCGRMGDWLREIGAGKIVFAALDAIVDAERRERGA